MGITELIRKGESETLEFKRKLNDSVYRTLSALANTAGGILLLGVSNGGKILWNSFQGTGHSCPERDFRKSWNYGKGYLLRAKGLLKVSC